MIRDFSAGRESGIAICPTAVGWAKGTLNGYPVPPEGNREGTC